jgi:hypothetical protein
MLKEYDEHHEINANAPSERANDKEKYEDGMTRS